MIKNGIKFMTDHEWKKVGEYLVNNGYTAEKFLHNLFAYSSSFNGLGIYIYTQVKRYANGQCVFYLHTKKYPNTNFRDGDLLQIADEDTKTRVIETLDELRKYLQQSNKKNGDRSALMRLASE